MEKQFTQKQIANWRRVRQNIEADLNKVNKLKKQINDLNDEIKLLNTVIDAQEYVVRMATDGYTSQEIFKKVVTDTGKVGPNGYPIRKTTYVLRYPDIVIPPIQGTISNNYSDADYMGTDNDIDTHNVVE